MFDRVPAAESMFLLLGLDAKKKTSCWKGPQSPNMRVDDLFFGPPGTKIPTEIPDFLLGIPSYTVYTVGIPTFRPMNSKTQVW